MRPGMVVYICNTSPQEAEAGGSQVQGQPSLRSKTLSQQIKKFKKKKRKDEKEAGEERQTWKYKHN
jgi:hypothetical protein